MYKYGDVIRKRILYFNVYVIKGKTGDILIDTGFICMKKYLKKWLSQFNIKLIILTHAHVDHIWNVSYIKKLYNCEVALYKDDIVNLDNSIINSKPLNDKFNLWTKVMNFGMKHFKQEEFDVDIELRDRQVIKRYGLTLKIYHLPGHTNGTIGIKYKDNLFVGDALVNRFGHPSLAYQNQSLDDAKRSVRVIENIKPDIIYLGHDKPIIYKEDILMNSF